MEGVKLKTNNELILYVKLKPQPENPNTIGSTFRRKSSNEWLKLSLGNYTWKPKNQTHFTSLNINRKEQQFF